MLGKIFAPVLKYSGISPVIGGLASLFGGGEETAAPATAKYVAPAPIRYEVTVPLTGSGTGPGPGVAKADAGQRSGTPVEVTVNVQAMDSRSFLDHSDAIASAVRDAMLRGHSLNDVVEGL